MNWPPETAARKTAGLTCATVGNKTANEVSENIAMNGCFRLELSAQTLLRLLASGQLCAADFRCLDCESKHCLRRLVLMSCAKTINPGSGCNGCCAECGKSEDRKFVTETDLPVLICVKSLPPASPHDSSTKQPTSSKN